MAGVCGEIVVVVVVVVSGKAEDDVGESKRPPAWLTRKRMGVESRQSGRVRRLGQHARLLSAHHGGLMLWPQIGKDQAKASAHDETGEGRANKRSRDQQEF